MTAKREAELETENRMLREQVAVLERIIAQVQPVFRLDSSQLIGCAAPQPLQQWYQWPPVTWCSTDVASNSLSGGS
jgi:hypothetical protein